MAGGRGRMRGGRDRGRKRGKRRDPEARRKAHAAGGAATGGDREVLFSNAQSDLASLEIGMHVLLAVGKGKAGRGNKNGIADWARNMGRKQPTMSDWVMAAQVAAKSNGQPLDLIPYMSSLSIIHRCPEDWADLAKRMLAGAWTKEQQSIGRRNICRVGEKCGTGRTGHQNPPAGREALRRVAEGDEREGAAPQWTWESESGVGSSDSGTADPGRSGHLPSAILRLPKDGYAPGREV